MRKKYTQTVILFFYLLGGLSVYLLLDLSLVQAEDKEIPACENLEFKETKGCGIKTKVIKEYNAKIKGYKNSLTEEDCKELACLLPALNSPLGQYKYVYCKDKNSTRREKDGSFTEENLRVQETWRSGKRRRRHASCTDQKYVALIHRALTEVGKCTEVNPKDILPLLIHESRLGLNAQSETGASCLGQITSSSIDEVYRVDFEPKKSNFKKRFNDSSDCEVTKKGVLESYGKFPDEMPVYYDKNGDKHRDWKHSKRRCQFTENPYLCLLFSMRYFKKNLEKSNKILSKCRDRFENLYADISSAGPSPPIFEKMAAWFKNPTIRHSIEYEHNGETESLTSEINFSVLLATWTHNAGVGLFAWMDNYCEKMVDDIHSETENFLKKPTTLSKLKSFENIKSFMREKIEEYKSLKNVKKHVSNRINAERFPKGRKKEILEYLDKTIRDTHLLLPKNCQPKSWQVTDLFMGPLPMKNRSDTDGAR